MILGAGAMAAGMGLSAYGTLEAGKEAARAGKTAQQQYEQEAKATRYAGQYASRLKRIEARRAKAKRIAQIGAGGGLLTGTKLLSLADEAVAYESDARVVMHNYQLRATGLRNQGILARYQGRMARWSSRIRAFANMGKSAGSLYALGSMGGGTKGTYSGGGGAGNPSQSLSYGNNMRYT